MTVSNMIAIVPAKADSTRVPDKNYREFYKGRSLVEITLERLLKAGLSRFQIYLSCDDRSKEVIARRFGVQFALREQRLADNETPFADVFKGILDGIGAWSNEDVLWAQVCDPLFNSHGMCIERWQYERSRPESQYDSLVVCHPVRGYYLDGDKRPCSGWGFGPWHVPSQRLPTFYQMPFTLSILTSEAIDRCGYWVGERPLWVPITGTHIDIDTEADWRLAQKMMEVQEEMQQSERDAEV